MRFNSCYVAQNTVLNTFVASTLEIEATGKTGSKFFLCFHFKRHLLNFFLSIFFFNKKWVERSTDVLWPICGFPSSVRELKDFERLLRLLPENTDLLGKGQYHCMADPLSTV